MKKNRRYTPYLVCLCGSILCLGLLAGCGKSDQSQASNSISDTIQESSASLSVEDSSQTSSVIEETKSDYATQTFNELTFAVPTEWVETSDYQDDRENTQTMTLDYYPSAPSSEAFVAFTYYDYSNDTEEDVTSMQAVVTSFASYMQSSDGMSAVSGLELLPTNKDLCVTTLEGTYSGEDDNGSYVVNTEYYFIPGENGVYQIGLSVDNTVDPSVYQDEFKKVYESIVVNDQVVEEATSPKFVTFFKASLEGLSSDYKLTLSDNGDGSFGLILNDEAQNASISFDDKQIHIQSGDITDENSMIATQIALSEVIFITSPEIGLSSAAYDEMNSMLDEFQNNAHYDEQYDITFKKNSYHFLAGETSLDITVDIR